ncbi:MAG: LLM class flavin-dependent oxidoreductase [Acidimicrobiales bacterium]
MKLGYGLDLYRAATLDVPIERVRLVESLGYHSVWTAEAYGCDAMTPLAYLAAHTSRIKLATGVVQLAARTPAATAMQAMTIDALAGGGRVIVGLGVSGPQIVEGWYGQPWGSPVKRLRDYVTIMRKVIAREEPVVHDGAEISLPYTGPGSIGQGKPLKSILHPAGDIEIWIAAGAPLNTALAAEICDGWLPMGYGADGWEIHGPHLEKGWARRGGRPADFDIMGGITIEITDDVQAAIDAKKPLTGMYVGAWAASRRTSTATRWLAGVPRGRGADPGAVAGRSQGRGHRSGARRIHRCWRPLRIARPDPVPLGRGIPAGVTGLTVRTDTDEGLELAAEMAGTRDTRRTHDRATGDRAGGGAPSGMSRSTARRSATPSPRRYEPSCSPSSRPTTSIPTSTCRSCAVPRRVLLVGLRPHQPAARHPAVLLRARRRAVDRQATDGWFSIWDLAKPVIAQVHGYAMAGATELASACDLVYVADGAKISYPVVRVASPPDWQYHEPLMGLRHAMEVMLTGDAMDGTEAARMGWANRAYPADTLEAEVLAIAPASPGWRPISPRSTSGWCTASSTWPGAAPPCGPARSSRPWRAIRRRWRPSGPTRSRR